MMRYRIPIAPVVLLGLLVLSCAGEANTGLDQETVEALDRVESEISEMTEEIDRSDLQQNLQSTWEGMEEEVTDAVDSIRSGEAVNAEEIEMQLDEFEQQLESMDVEQSVEDAWTELRAEFDELMARVG